MPTSAPVNIKLKFNTSWISLKNMDHGFMGNLKPRNNSLAVVVIQPPAPLSYAPQKLNPLSLSRRILPLEFVGSSCLPFDSGGRPPLRTHVHPSSLHRSWPAPPSPPVRDCELLGRISRRRGGRAGGPRGFSMEDLRSGRMESEKNNPKHGGASNHSSIYHTHWMDGG